MASSFVSGHFQFVSEFGMHNFSPLRDSLLGPISYSLYAPLPKEIVKEIERNCFIVVQEALNFTLLLTLRSPLTWQVLLCVLALKLFHRVS